MANHWSVAQEEEKDLVIYNEPLQQVP